MFIDEEKFVSLLRVRIQVYALIINASAAFD